MELWDILDKDRKPTGKLIHRGDRMNQDEYHLVVDIWIKNPEGKFLISKRTPNKTFPGIWESTGGSAVSGDDSLKTAMKEVREELGLTLDSSKGKLIYQGIRQNKDYPSMIDAWLFEQDFQLSAVVFQQDEVCGAQWADKEEILLMISQGSFYQHYEYLDIVFG